MPTAKLDIELDLTDAVAQLRRLGQMFDQMTNEFAKLALSAYNAADELGRKDPQDGKSSVRTL